MSCFRLPLGQAGEVFVTQHLGESRATVYNDAK